MTSAPVIADLHCKPWKYVRKGQKERDSYLRL